MKNLILLIIVMSLGLQGVSVCGQQFQNLNFENANPVMDPTSDYYPNAVTAASALPGWSVYLGAEQQTDVLQNYYFLNQATVDIFGPDYSAAGANGPYSPGVIDGNYSVMLQAGTSGMGVPQNLSASIEQSGHVPAAAQSLQFETYLATPYTAFDVSMNGNVLTPVVLGTGANYTLYAVDIAPYAGTKSELEFSALFTTGQPSGFELDDIAFSDTAVSPEPSSWILTAVGGLIFAFYGTRPGGRIFAARKCLAHR